MTKRVYVVKGSETGIDAVAGNFKAAYRLAVGYAEANHDQFLTYSEALKEIRKYGSVNVCVHDDRFGNSEICETLFHTK